MRNNTLFCSIFSNYKANTCAGCGSTLHMSDFCPSLVMRTNDSVTNQAVATPAVPNVGSLAYRGNTSRDIGGRMRVIHNGNEICNNFNSLRGCRVFHCKFIHLCLICKGKDHAKFNCETSKNWKGQGQRIPTLR